MRRLALVVPILLPQPAPAAFERLPTGPAAAALGGLVAVSPDPVFGNPAAVAPRLHLEIWGARPFGLSALNEAQASLHGPCGRAGLGVGVRRFGSHVYGEHEARLQLGWSADPRAPPCAKAVCPTLPRRSSN